MKYHDLMYEIGLDNFIYVSSDRAKDVRVLPKDLPKNWRHVRVWEVTYGIYRVSNIAQTQLDQYAEALFRVE
jgi:hypothetical protein